MSLSIREEWVEVRRAPVDADGAETEDERRIGLGESGVYETAYDTPGELYRALQGRSRRSWEESMGRCTGKVYVDMDGKARHVGWVFLRRRTYEDSPKTYLQETWVTVHDAPDTVTRTPHYASLEG
jgi:hypothetical protein